MFSQSRFKTSETGFVKPNTLKFRKLLFEYFGKFGKGVLEVLKT
jgi:hypothetical protein